MTTLPNIPLSRSALLGVLATIQNGPTFAQQDIMSFAGMCSTDELAAHVMASFQRLGTAEKVFALEALQSRVAPAPAYMVPQPCQQQQAQAKRSETAAEWAARMDRKKPRRAPRPVAEDSPAMKAGLAIAAEAGRAHAERRMAAAAEHDITVPLALAGRYRSAR